MAKALTVAAVDKLKAEAGKRVEIPDGLLPGLYLIVQPSGKKSWAVRYRAAGAPKKLTLGPYPAIELGAARELAREAMLKAQRGADPAAEKKDARLAAKAGMGDDAFVTVARSFIRRYAIPKNKSWLEAARTIGLRPDPEKPKDAMKPETFLVIKGSPADKWSKKRIGDVTRRDIVALLDATVDRGTPIAANRTLAHLRRLFGWATERDLIPANPASGAKAPSPETRRDRTLSSAEIKAVWKASDCLGPPFGPMVRVLILTGQRRDEVAGMTEKELDRQNLLWTIPAERAKNGKEHQLPIPSAVLDALAEAKPVEGLRKLIFTTTGENPVSGFDRAKKRLDAEMVKVLQKQAVEAGLDPAEVAVQPWTFHDLRRSMSTIMHDDLDIAPHVVEAVLNHVSGHRAGVAGTYNRAKYLRQMREALTAWAGFIEQLTASPLKADAVEDAA